MRGRISPRDRRRGCLSGGIVRRRTWHRGGKGKVRPLSDVGMGSLVILTLHLSVIDKYIDHVRTGRKAVDVVS